MEKPKKLLNQNSNWLFQVFFLWLTPLIYKGSKTFLSQADLYKIDLSIFDFYLTKFQTLWKLKNKTKKFALVQVLAVCFKRFLITSGIFGLFSRICDVISILLFKQIMKELILGTDKQFVAILSALFFLSSLLSNIFDNGCWYFTTYTSCLVRSILFSSIYQKSLKLSAKSKSAYSSGNIINIASDAQRLEIVIRNIHYLWVNLVYFISLTVILIMNLGIAGGIGVLFFVAVIPLHYYMIKKYRKHRKISNTAIDNRVKLISEILGGIKVIKFYAWESSFYEQIAKFRKVELSKIRVMRFIGLFLSSISTLLPVMASLFSFTIYSLSGHELTADIIFPSLAMFSMLTYPIDSYPNYVFELIEGNVCLKRIFTFLKLEELENKAIYDESMENAIEIVNGTFSWTKEPVLRNINISIKKGSLVGIVGSVGSGKTSLLNAIIGEMKFNSGFIKYNGNLGYCSQHSWLKNSTLQENILFDLPFASEKYDQIIQLCELERDLEILKDGDLTPIGEKGINLSGGQKQRISLARLIYYDADILLLDDPLSAVDSRIGKSLFENCINDFLQDKTRLLVTHHLHLLPKMDLVIVMDKGEIKCQGSYEELLENPFFVEMMEKHKIENDDEEIDSAQPEGVSAEDEAGELEDDEEEYNEDEEDEEDGGEEEQSSLKESKQRKEVYLDYFKAAGGLYLIVIALFLVLISTLFSVSSDLWLSFWSQKRFKFTNSFYMAIFGLISVLLVLTRVLANLSFLLMNYYAAVNLFEGAFNKVLKSPMSFFDNTPLGKIINRLSKDQRNIDFGISSSFYALLRILFDMIGSFIMICIILPLFSIPFAILSAGFYYVQKLFRKTLCKLLKIESKNRANLIAQLSESLSGLSTIRAYGEQELFYQKCKLKLLDLDEALFSIELTYCWLFALIGILGNLLLLISALLCVYLEISSSLSGLILGTLLSLNNQFFSLIARASALEAEMTSVERVVAYSKYLTTEKSDYVENNRPSESWPEKGEIEFKQISLKYRDDLPNVLSNFSLKIPANSRVGIVGRSGAGKSSIMLALFRLVEPTEGEIIIDGINILDIGIRDLRTKLAIIPQDPILFSGTIRSNLDPFNQHSEQELWTALENSSLKSHVQQLELKLDSKVEELGNNFSGGQKQLFCLSRAMLKSCKILILDEATANVDFMTDSIIQEALRSNFRNSTILTIAHRLDTIMDYDLVVVMENGEIAEADSPKNLINDSNSAFCGMAKETGESNFARLKSLAEQ